MTKFDYSNLVGFKMLNIKKFKPVNNRSYRPFMNLKQADKDLNIDLKDMSAEDIALAFLSGTV